MRFTKMQGIGNDYVYVNCFEETVADPAAVARFVSDRHFGIGSDGLILIGPSGTADCRMDMYNMDGSRGVMCGNGVRCVGKYAYDHGLVPGEKRPVYRKTSDRGHGGGQADLRASRADQRGREGLLLCGDQRG